MPAPLEPGAILHRRFVLEALLGQGDFGATYRARDQERGDVCVVRELGPKEVERNQDGELVWTHLTEPATWRLRQAFVDASRAVSRTGARGVLPVRASFTEHGTAYVVTEYLEGAQTLRELGKLEASEVTEILLDLLDTLQYVHRAGVLHGDIRPSNILVTPSGRAYLIDFGSARVWCADCIGDHLTVLSASTSPPEMLDCSGRRGPASDLYALAASLYQTLTGEAPPAAEERQEGERLTPVEVLVPDVPIGLAAALEAALALSFSERPQSAPEMRLILSETQFGTPTEEVLEGFDERAAKLMQFRFERFECPQCSGVLERPSPLRRLECPVCRDGFIQKRRIDPRSCAVCKGGPLRRTENVEKLRICPVCSTGLLVSERRRLFSRELQLRCPECEAAFEAEVEGLRLLERGKRKDAPEVGEFNTRDEWRLRSGRPEWFELCESCGAQFDPVPGDRLRLMVPERYLKETELTAQEWGRVAAGLSPFAGNAECDACFSDFVLETTHVTLVAEALDPYLFAERYRDRRLKIEDLRWVGVGKTSPAAGLVCSGCGLEIDPEGPVFRLIQTSQARLLAHVGQVESLEDWHRLARGLPRVQEESDFEAAFDAALLEAYRTGKIGFRNVEGLIWSGKATRRHLRGTDWVAGRRVQVEIHETGLTFSDLWRRRRLSLDNVARVVPVGDGLILEMLGDRDAVGLQLPPTDLVANLASGTRRVSLTPGLVAERLSRLVGAARSV